MPVEQATCIDKNIVYMKWSGVVDYDLVMGGLAAARSDKHFRPDGQRLVDARDVTDIAMDYNLLRSVVRQKNAGGAYGVEDCRSVIYAPDETTFGVTRMVQTMTELAGGTPIEVYQDECEVLAALGLEHDSIAEFLAAEDFVPATPSEDRASSAG